MARVVDGAWVGAVGPGLGPFGSESVGSVLPVWRVGWGSVGTESDLTFLSYFLPCSPPTPFMPFTSTLPLPPAPAGPSAPDAEDEEDYDS